ncbi:2-phosphosulfolactate phosphatase family protein [Clostridiaceae bacterium UIB06]|uniref:Probable 2-phosphosulfolactate phosphatase n=1 Tax=Clostridium thailandense TaxID=2794346 RepID=A0A949WQX4_9CLOT|nr:2-phosphosulfolactate phosphatase family protein [Clostridium thailandense]MBV7273305.1 2-phosphosulfolactate phosphatase family protein [Clostridium thailandense]MCH5137330.1 2-phosphosulfolactate phosphatase family protein [Clostridiaceae bacterium UIB06]
MEVDLIISADDIKKEKITGKSVVIIDMLRATSVITTAIYNGCDSVIPVLTIEEALEKASEGRGKYILGGERKALKIEGFDCANSPLEYKEDIVKGKTLIMTTSNGTRAIKGSLGASSVLIGALINAKAVAEKLLALDNDVVIINAGTCGQFSMDDFICSGYIINCLLSQRKDIGLTDISKTANYVYEENEDIISFIKYASHYKRIKELNLEKDLDYCCSKDIIDIVPMYKNGIIALFDEQKEEQIV